MPCSGDNNRICGGGGANSVYSVCPIGNYGKSCAGTCQCYNDERCIYRNSSCPSPRCKEGWSGSSCNTRDCNTSNGDCHIHETCYAINLNYSTVSVCRCPNGFQRNDICGNCTDTDECSLKVCDPVTMICTNTIGSYNCSCKRGFQAHSRTSCIDIDECQQNICDNSTTVCNNTHGSYNCSCKQGFSNFNGRNCAGDEEHFGAIGAAVGSLFAVVVVATMAFAFLFFCRRRIGICQSNPNESSISKTTAKDLTVNPSQGDETEQDLSRPCKSNCEESSRNKPSDKGKSADYVNLNAEVPGSLGRSAKDEAALKAASDNNTYESLNFAVSGFDETRIYAELKL